MRIVNITIEFLLRDVPIHIANILTAALPNHYVTNRIRGLLIRPFLGSGGKRLQIGKGVIINNPKRLYLGNDCYISHYCYIQAKGNVTLEDNVIVGPMSVIASSKHIVENGMVTNKGVSDPIFIGKGTWCGGHVVISSGVRIGKSVVVGASAVVTKDIVDGVKVGGVPAKII